VTVSTTSWRATSPPSLTFDEDSRRHTFDLGVAGTQDDYEAGYDECDWSTDSRVSGSATHEVTAPLAHQQIR
jgi:hypothetical protein